MAAPESTKFQVNYKLADGTLINLYATDVKWLIVKAYHSEDLGERICVLHQRVQQTSATLSLCAK